MSPRRSSRSQKHSENFLSSNEEEDIQRKYKGRIRRTATRKTEDLDEVVDVEDGCECDILDSIDSTHETTRNREERRGMFVEVMDKGVDESDADCVSVSSMASGPSDMRETSSRKNRAPQGLCSTCRQLSQRAKKMKKPKKDRLLDNDPKSLTCDQWVLIKTWRPRRLPNIQGKLVTSVQMVKKLLRKKKVANLSDPCLRKKQSPACSRPHTFLQRNLRQCIPTPIKTGKKKSKRKRKSNSSQGPRISKKQRLHSNHQHIINSSPDDNSSPNDNSLRPASRNSINPSNEHCSDGEMDDVVLELVPSEVMLETTKVKPSKATQEARKERGRFRDLLAQLRGTSSMIVREKR